MTISPTYRIMCCLLAALLLFTCVSRPLEVSATGLEAAAAGFVGIAPEVAIPIILVLLGVAYVGAHWDQISNVVEDALDSFKVEINDDVYISGYEYNGKTYIDHAIVDAVANSVLEYNEAKFGDAWDLGKDFRYMYTIKYTNNYRQAYIWTDSAVNVTNDGNYTHFDCTGDYVSYYAYTGSNPYNETYDSRTDPAVGHAFSMSNNLFDTYSVTDMTGVLDPTITYGDTIAVTNPVTEEEEMAIPIAPTTSVPATKTEEEVIVTPTTPDVVPGTGTSDLSGILSWLKAIWNAITGLASKITAPIVEVINSVIDRISTATNAILQQLGNAITSVRTAITTGVTTITDTITKTIADIIEWLKSMGATLADILEWIKTLPASIAQAISTVITDVFVPSADFISEKVDAITSRFAWIAPLVDIAQGLSVDLSSSTPPVVYVHLEDSESEYIKGGTVKFIDMSWYARYKPYGDVILSGFLWALFAWRMYLKIPGIINGVGGSVGHIASSGGYRRKEDGE